MGEVFEHRTFFSRLHHFVFVSDAFVVVPGGIGTVLELTLVWQLLQERKLYRTPLILIGPMWRALVEWTRRHFLRPEFQLADPSDIDIPHCVDTVEEAIALIRRHHEQWIAELEKAPTSEVRPGDGRAARLGDPRRRRAARRSEDQRPLTSERQTK